MGDCYHKSQTKKRLKIHHPSLFILNPSFKFASFRKDLSKQRGENGVILDILHPWFQKISKNKEIWAHQCGKDGTSSFRNAAMAWTPTLERWQCPIWFSHPRWSQHRKRFTQTDHLPPTFVWAKPPPSLDMRGFRYHQPIWSKQPDKTGMVWSGECSLWINMRIPPSLRQTILNRP